MAKTVIHQDLEAKWGEEDHLQVSQTRSFSSMIFETLSERVPTQGELTVFELILNLSIDHGSETPSAVKTIEATKDGKTISESIAAGILEINDVHGGAIEPAMELFYKIQKGEITVEQVVNESSSEKRIPGFGHRIYKDLDPRAELILAKLDEGNLGQDFIDLSQELKEAIQSQKDRKLPLNIDGAIAVALCAFGWNPNLGKAVFIIARVPGLCGQFLNNLTEA